MIFKDVHEPIIDRETFEQVQKLVSKTKRRSPKPENGEKSMFSDLLYCADCGSKLWYHTNTNNKAIKYFSCSNYVKDFRGTCPTRHYIREDALKEVVTLELCQMAKLLINDEDHFAEMLAKKAGSDREKEEKNLEEVINKASVRNATVSRLFEKLYEDNATGKVTDEWFMELSRKYENERIELKAKISESKRKLDDLKSAKRGEEQFLNAFRRFVMRPVLTHVLLKELIDRIEVYETEGKGKNRTQKIAICYKFVGYIDTPEAPTRKHYRSDTRQGVAIEYVPEARA